MAAIGTTPHLHPIDIPDDILRLILEELFNLLDTFDSRKLDLTLLSKDIRAWLQPLLYRHLDMSRWPHDLSTIFGDAHRQGMFTHTRSIFIKNRHHMEWIPMVLQACSNTVQLACCFAVIPEDEQETLATTCQSLRRLSMIFEVVENTFDINQPFFQSLTHLDLTLWTDVEPEPDMSLLQGLGYLSNLLYFGLCMKFGKYTDSGTSSTLAEAIASKFPPALRLALVWRHNPEIDFDYHWLVEECDPRIVFWVENQCPEWEYLSEELIDLVLQKDSDELDWNPGMHPDLWERAEEALEKRRALKRQ